jgi:hypothetical protein
VVAYLVQLHRPTGEGCAADDDCQEDARCFDGRCAARVRSPQCFGFAPESSSNLCDLPRDNPTLIRNLPVGAGPLIVELRGYGDGIEESECDGLPLLFRGHSAPVDLDDPTRALVTLDLECHLTCRSYTAESVLATLTHARTLEPLDTAEKVGDLRFDYGDLFENRIAFFAGSAELQTALTPVTVRFDGASYRVGKVGGSCRALQAILTAGEETFVSVSCLEAAATGLYNAHVLDEETFRNVSQSFDFPAMIEGVVIGTVVDAKGVPVEGARVEHSSGREAAYDLDAGWLRETGVLRGTTGPSGAFYFAGQRLPEGTLTVTAAGRTFTSPRASTVANSVFVTVIRECSPDDTDCP